MSTGAGVCEQGSNEVTKKSHTTGPWLAAASPSSVVGWPVVGPMGRSICNVSWMPKKAYPDVSEADYAAFNAECEANARLIAAAPQLLAALERIADPTSMWSEHAQIAQDAIDAARGHGK